MAKVSYRGVWRCATIYCSDTLANVASVSRNAGRVEADDWQAGYDVESLLLVETKLANSPACIVHMYPSCGCVRKGE